MCTTFGIISSSSFAEDFYKWKDADGVTHYGSSPPLGVNAKKVRTYGSSKNIAEDEDVSARKKLSATSGDESVALDPETKAKMDKNCNIEKQRLSTLKSGRPIRMTKADGTQGLLTQAELSSEIAKSENAITALCGT